MYMILVWELNGNYLTCVKTATNSIRLFDYEDAEEYIKKAPKKDDYRIIGIEKALNPNI